jgi:hypothetical protein
MTDTQYDVDFPISVVYALHHVRDVSLALDRVHAQGLTCEEAQCLVDDSSTNVARLTLGLEGAGSLVRGSNLDRDHAHALIFRLISQFDGDLTLTRDLIGALHKAHSLALERDLGLAPALDSALYRARCLARELEDACISLHDFRRATGAAAPPAGSGLLQPTPPARPAQPAQATQPAQSARWARSAWWVAGWAVRILPGAYRGRYTEEYACELGELAARGATWRQQWDYALQVLFNALSLRRALRRPVNPPARDR